MQRKLSGFPLRGPHGRACSAPKGRPHRRHRRAVARARADVAEGEVSAAIEDEITAHLGQVELLRAPDPSPEDETDVAPNRAWGCDRHQTPASSAEVLVAETGGIGKPQERVPQAFGEALQLIGAGE